MPPKRGVANGIYEWDPSQATSERGKAHVAALNEQQLQPLMPVPLLQRRWTLFGLSLLCALFAISLHLMKSSNLLLTLRPHDFEQCKVLTGPVGAEDVALDARSVAFVSADARTWVPTLSRDGFTDDKQAHLFISRLGPDEQGAIWCYDSRPPIGGSASSSDSAAAGEGSKPTLGRGRLTRLTIENLPSDFLDLHPHGIAIPALPGVAGAVEPTWLYVLNHERGGNAVLVLEVVYDDAADAAAKAGSLPSPPRLFYRGSMRDLAHLGGVNDLDAPYPLRQEDGTWLHSVYVSNFLGSAIGDSKWMMVEMLTQAKWGSVALCQASTSTSPSGAAGAGAGAGDLDARCTFAVEGVSGPNGVALSPDHKRLYVACTMTMELRVYSLPQSQSQFQSGGEADATAAEWRHGSLALLPLRLEHTLHLGTGLDNISIDPDSGDMLIGAHPKPLDVAAHLDDPAKRAPTQVLRVHRRTTAEIQVARDAALAASGKAAAAAVGELAVSEVHLSDGQVFSGSSVGVWSHLSNELIIGGVAQDGIFVCPFPEQR
jgi:hypothetical protein